MTTFRESEMTTFEELEAKLKDALDTTETRPKMRDALDTIRVLKLERVEAVRLRANALDAIRVLKLERDKLGHGLSYAWEIINEMRLDSTRDRVRQLKAFLNENKKIYGFEIKEQK